MPQTTQPVSAADLLVHGTYGLRCALDRLTDPPATVSTPPGAEHAPPDEGSRGTDQRRRQAAEREDDEATWLEMLAEVDEQAAPTAAMASTDRAIAIELQMEARYLREKQGRASRGT
jgi:hypothetical protein